MTRKTENDRRPYADNPHNMQSIVEDLKGTTTEGIWVGTSYLLANAVVMPFLASISHIFGRPMLLVFSVATFAVGSIICALSHTIAQLLAGRSVQGIGGGGIVVISLVTFTDIVPLRHRPKWYGTVQGAWALGTCVGPVLGGAIAQNTTWRWVFWVMLPFCAFGLVTIPILLTIKPRVETMGEKLRRVDWVGSAVFMGSATSFLIAISWGGTQFAWSSVQTIVPLVVGAAGLAGTGVWERYVKEPLFRRELFDNISGVATYICSATQGSILFGQLYYIPFYFMSALAYSPVKTGVAVLPVMLTLVPASIVTGVLITRYNSYTWPIWIGWAMETVAIGLTTMWDESTHIAVWVVTCVILGLGHGSILNAQNFGAQAICGAGDEANAAAMYAFMRHFGMALGVGIGGSTFQNIMALKLGWLGVPESKNLASNAEGFLPTLLAMPDSQEKRDILAGYVHGLKGVFFTYLGICILSLLVSLFIKNCDMNKELVSEHKLQSNRLSVLVTSRRGGTDRPSMVHRTSEEPLSAVEEDDEDAHLPEVSQTSSHTEVEVDVPAPVLLPKPALTPRMSSSSLHLGLERRASG